MLELIPKEAEKPPEQDHSRTSQDWDHSGKFSKPAPRTSSLPWTSDKRKARWRYRSYLKKHGKSHFLGVTTKSWGNCSWRVYERVSELVTYNMLQNRRRPSWQLHGRALEERPREKAARGDDHSGSEVWSDPKKEAHQDFRPQNHYRVRLVRVRKKATQPEF